MLILSPGVYRISIPTATENIQKTYTHDRMADTQYKNAKSIKVLLQPVRATFIDFRHYHFAKIENSNDQV